MTMWARGPTSSRSTSSICSPRRGLARMLTRCGRSTASQIATTRIRTWRRTGPLPRAGCRHSSPASGGPRWSGRHRPRERRGKPLNVYDYLLASAQPGAPAILSRQESVSYGELAALAESVAVTLQQAGVGKGDRAGILAENSAFWAACYLGILKLGAVAVPFPARLNAEQLNKLAELTGCAALCCDSGRLRQHAAHLPPRCAVVTPGTAAAGDAPASARIVAPGVGSCPTAEIDEREDLAALMFTSGSTGEPNAVRVSHHNIMVNTDGIIEYLGLHADDRMMVV